MDINNDTMLFDETEQAFYFIYNNDLIINNHNIDIIIDSNITYKFKNITIVSDVKDVIKVKYYRKPDRSLNFVNVPIIAKDIFESDKKYYTEKMISIYESVPLNSQNSPMRQISDDIELRPMNTYFIPAIQLQQSTLQEYNFDLVLPLKFTTSLIIDKQYIIENKLNLTDEINNLRYYIAETLNNEYTGTNISFYKSQLTDYIHNTAWVKSVSVNIYDSNDTLIPNGNIESLLNKEIVDKMDKETLLDFVSVFWYWNLNSITVNYDLS